MIELRSASFSYDGTRQALDGVSLTVRRGERVAVLGHNGSGKSTLVKLLGALQVPAQGVCCIAGRDVRDIPFRELRRLVGIVFQDPENQIVAAVVEDDIAFAPENQGLPPDEIQKRVDRALEKVGLLHKRNSVVSALSGGEKQRMALAGALAAQVECLILDEPTAMLDPEGRLEVELALRAIHRSGTTLVQVTHQLENFEDIDRVFVLARGRLVWQGTTEDFWPEAEKAGFELPPLYRLADRSGFTGERVNVDTVSKYLSSHLSNSNRSHLYSGSLKNNLNKPVSSSFSSPFIQVRDLSFQFQQPGQTGQQAKDRPMALENVSADAAKADWLSIVGRTGSGKSTLVQHLNGLYRIQSGQILIENEPLPQKGKELHTLRRRVGLVFQSPEDQLFSATVKDELAFAPANAGISGEELERAVMDSLECVGLDAGFLARSPLALSGGERRLVAIASVLAAGPECVVLDEPLAGLDAFYRRRILTLLSRLRDEGRSIVTITHDLDMALQFSDRVLVMDAGRSLGEGSVQSILPALMAAIKVWPEVLQVSARLHAEFPFVPVTWDPDSLLCAIKK